MKEFKSNGISMENMVGETPGKGKGASPKTNQTISLPEDLIWELRTFAADHRRRGVKTVLEEVIGCFVKEDGTLDRDKLECFWKEYVEK